MLYISRPFDKIQDMQEVDQFGYVNLCESYANGVISGNLAVETGKMNDIEYPGSIIGRPSDEFDAIALNKTIRDRGVKSADPSGNDSSE